MDPAADEPTTVSQRLLDVFVFAPAGLVVTAVEEFPRLVERGREQLTGRITSARTVGSFAVTAGRSQLLKRAEDLRRNRATAGGPAVEETEGADNAPRPDGPVVRAASTPSRSASPDTVAQGEGATRDGTSVPLAIPGFDTLSASQVVQRLDGLTADELVAVRAHESGRRGRRTILNRVEQLLDERS
ncbi:MAG TPA: hypothetical protein VG226_06085 [Acidimicrobiales bacterium]|jgi:hypothetical protein|nr:hypothetical protein [Acidimicrobiales bacterium]